MSEPVRLPQSTEAALRELDRIAHGARERVARSHELQERMAGLTGEATSPDGLVRVVRTPGDPLHRLTIEPRAMRMYSVDLAETIRTVAAEARQDLDRNTREVTRELFGDDAAPLGALTDPHAAQAKLAELGELASSSATDAAAVFERLMRGLRR